jgi:hypothetical protein
MAVDAGRAVALVELDDAGAQLAPSREASSSAAERTRDHRMDERGRDIVITDKERSRPRRLRGE